MKGPITGRANTHTCTHARTHTHRRARARAHTVAHLAPQLEEPSPALLRCAAGEVLGDGAPRVTIPLVQGEQACIFVSAPGRLHGLEGVYVCARTHMGRGCEYRMDLCRVSRPASSSGRQAVCGGGGCECEVGGKGSKCQMDVEEGCREPAAVKHDRGEG